MTKKEILKDIKKLIVKVKEYHDQQKPDSNLEFWSEDVFDRLCSIPSDPPALKKRYDELADMIDDVYGAGAGRR